MLADEKPGSGPGGKDHHRDQPREHEHGFFLGGTEPRDKG